MPIFFKNDQKILFIHIPKTGGTYVERMFKLNGYDHQLWMQPDEHAFLSVMHCSPQHLHWTQLKSLLTMRKFDCIFTVVRHPLSRFISEYHMRTRHQPEDFNDWAMRAFDRYQKNKFAADNHLRPQVEFIADEVTVYRYEDGLDADWALRLQAQLGADAPALALPGRPPKKAHPAVEPSAAVIDRLQQVYVEDFQRLGYALS